MALALFNVYNMCELLMVAESFGGFMSEMWVCSNETVPCFITPIIVEYLFGMVSSISHHTHCVQTNKQTLFKQHVHVKGSCHLW